MQPERMKAWQCIGCGRLEASQTCLGICQDRPVELVYAEAHEAALAEARIQTRELAAILRQLASVTPRAGECERTYKALQARARQALAALDR